MADSTPLKILCIGDSLTEGYSCFGLQFTPYGDTMKEVLQKRWPDREIEVITDGVSGDLVTEPGGRFMERLKSHFPSDPPITHTIILGGTNDIAVSRAVSDIYSTIQAMTTLAINHSSHVLLLTVPECHAKTKRVEDEREELNELLLTRLGGWKGVSTYDLKSNVPYHDMDEEQREMFWDDGLHFTEEGYKLIGELVGRRLVEVIEQGNTGENGGETDPVDEE
ncbi:hypothetical protein CJF32_00006878 [Rutstroemia sp. NJR-2017a WRK4]|nr:hypothetical protein CJF32_00006878 [Rutstroemia sp. NJR-2017a WRK4]